MIKNKKTLIIFLIAFMFTMTTFAYASPSVILGYERDYKTEHKKCITTSDANETTINLTMASGFNLIGISLYRDIQLSEIRFNGLTYSQAKAQGKIVSINGTVNLTHKDKEISILRKGKAYWIQTTESGVLTMPTIKTGIESYKLTDLMFRNGSGVEKNITDAVAEGWVGNDNGLYDIFFYWDKDLGWISMDPDFDSLDGWKGYFVNGLKNNITMLRQNGETITVLNEGWNSFGLNDNSTVTTIKTCEKPRPNKHTKPNQKIIIGVKGGKTEDINTYFQDNLVIKLPPIKLN